MELLYLVEYSMGRKNRTQWTKRIRWLRYALDRHLTDFYNTVVAFNGAGSAGSRGPARCYCKILSRDLSRLRGKTDPGLMRFAGSVGCQSPCVGRERSRLAAGRLAVPRRCRGEHACFCQRSLGFEARKRVGRLCGWRKVEVRTICWALSPVPHAAQLISISSVALFTHLWTQSTKRRRLRV
jgi:hypothetical protein